LDYTHHEYFNKNSYHIDSILSNFVENMLDISLNEVSVHYLGHTEVELEYLYMGIENEIIANNQEFINYYTTNNTK